MKKILFFLLFSLSLLFVGCGAKEAPAEVLLIGEDQEEILYQIKKTENLEEVKEIFKNLNTAKIENSFNGISLDFKAELEGKVIITNREIRTIDLGYTLDINAIANLKKYRMSGTLLLDGFTNTDSESLTLKAKNKLLLDLKNDDTYLYFKGSLEEGDNQLSLKNKMNIEDITKEYKTAIASFMDIMKYYKPLDFIPEYQTMIDEYQITICKTTRDSFTLRLRLPANIIFKDLETDLLLALDMEISCKNLLPIHLQFQADDAISMILEDKYIEQYLSSDVKVKNAKLKVTIKIKYDNYIIEELTEEEKTKYKEYFIKE